MSRTLGTYLRSLRQAAGWTLRDVTKRCGVSNAYVSQLEHERVREPSPHALRALADCYATDYLDLLRRAGYPIPTAPAPGPRVEVTFVGADQLTVEDQAEVQEIILMKLRRHGGIPVAVSSHHPAGHDLVNRDEERASDAANVLMTPRP